jgi:hypothetical protein
MMIANMRKCIRYHGSDDSARVDGPISCPDPKQALLETVAEGSIFKGGSGASRKENSGELFEADTRKQHF